MSELEKYLLENQPSECVVQVANGVVNIFPKDESKTMASFIIAE